MRVRVRKAPGQVSAMARSIWAPSLIRRILRRRAIWGVVAIVAAGVLSVSMANRVQAVEQEREDWGTTTSVVVVNRPVAAGEPVAHATSVEHLPAAMIPHGAVMQLPNHALAKVALFPGEILIEGRITSTSSGIPDGSVALTMAVQAQIPLLAVGDLVDVWAVDPATASSRRVAANVVVLVLTKDDITIAVPAEQVADATVAALRPVTITLIG